MKLVVKMQFGSHLYGTNVETSDLDYKGISLPSAEEILLQKVKKSRTTSTKSNANAKNEAGDIDLEIFSLDQYIRLLMQGQTVALDMLFASENFIVESDYPEIWKKIRDNKDKFLHSGILSFVGYCKTQANKYGIKGSRMGSMHKVVDALKEYVNNAEPTNKVKLHHIWNVCEKLTELEHVNIIELFANKATQDKKVLHFEVCGRKFDGSVGIDYAYHALSKIYESYGDRARQAERNEGIDWKALMHAVRVCYEATELLRTGNITFPRPERDLLLQIRKGELPYKIVAKIIEDGLEELEVIKESSKLPDKPDKEFAEKFILECYRDIVINETN